MKKKWIRNIFYSWPFLPSKNKSFSHFFLYHKFHISAQPSICFISESKQLFGMNCIPNIKHKTISFCGKISIRRMKNLFYIFPIRISPFTTFSFDRKAQKYQTINRAISAKNKRISSCSGCNRFSFCALFCLSIGMRRELSTGKSTPDVFHSSVLFSFSYRRTKTFEFSADVTEIEKMKNENEKCGYMIQLFLKMHREKKLHSQPHETRHFRHHLDFIRFLVRCLLMKSNYFTFPRIWLSNMRSIQFSNKKTNSEAKKI